MLWERRVSMLDTHPGLLKFDLQIGKFLEDIHLCSKLEISTEANEMFVFPKHTRVLLLKLQS